MTECERLIAEGLFPKEFFEPEVRCGIEVDVLTKKIWALSIDLLLQIDRICQKHDLQYFAIGGTAIGAVRHKGFIPWDDDMDVAMKREDYDRFVQIAPKELEAPYFLQTPETDPWFISRSFAKLRNSNTTCINFEDNRTVPCNNGLFIDIFPLDAVDADDKKCRAFVEREHKKFKLANNSLYFNVRKKKSSRMKLYKKLDAFLFPGGVGNWYRKHEKLCASFRTENYGALGLQYDLFGWSWDKWCWDKHVFDGTVLVPFENIEIRLPSGYDAMLRAQYGEYMKFPEHIEKTHPWETDPDTPYKEYCSKKYGTKY